MNGQKEVLVCSGANDVRCKEELPGEYGRILQAYGAGHLEQQHQEDKVFGQRLWSAKLRYLIRMSIRDCKRPRYSTSGWALMIACLLVLCGSSVYDQKNGLLSDSDVESSALTCVRVHGEAVAVTTEDCIFWTRGEIIQSSTNMIERCSPTLIESRDGCKVNSSTHLSFRRSVVRERTGDRQGPSRIYSPPHVRPRRPRPLFRHCGTGQSLCLEDPQVILVLFILEGVSPSWPLSWAMDWGTSNVIACAPWFLILALTRTASVNGQNSVNSHDNLAKGQVQNADKDEDDSEDDKDDTGHADGDGANGGKVTLCEDNSSFLWSSP